MKKNIGWLITGSVGIICISFLLDLFDIPSSLGLNMEAINWDALSLIVGNLLVILIAVITYLLIDKRNREKDKNQREVALLLLTQTYEQCKESVLLFERPEVLEKAVEKCDFDKVLHEDKQMMYYLEHPFEFHEKIMEFACSGTISQKEFSDYMEVRTAFKKHIDIRIMFFDHGELPAQTKKEFFETFNRVTSSLNRGEQ